MELLSVLALSPAVVFAAGLAVSALLAWVWSRTLRERLQAESARAELAARNLAVVDSELARLRADGRDAAGGEAWMRAELEMERRRQRDQAAQLEALAQRLAQAERKAETAAAWAMAAEQQAAAAEKRLEEARAREAPPSAAEREQLEKARRELAAERDTLARREAQLLEDMSAASRRLMVAEKELARLRSGPGKRRSSPGAGSGASPLEAP